MLIFVLPSWYKTEKYPENCLFIYEQIQALREAGHQIVVLSVQAERRRSRHNDTAVNDNGIVTYYTYIPAFAPSKFRALFVSGFRRALRRMYDRAAQEYGKPDLLYAHFTFAAGYAALSLSRDTGVPLAVQEHYSGLMSEQIDGALRRYVKETAQEADAFICVSEGLKQSILKKTGVQSDIRVVSNMIHPCFRFYEPTPKDEFVFFSCGSLIKRKRFGLLIEAFAEAFDNDKSVRLRIGGSGTERSRLNDLIIRLKLEDRVSLIGQLNREQTLEEYRRCDAFVLASSAETFGLVYREALAVGRPVISTRHGGFCDADWRDEYGCLIDVDNKAQLADALRRIYADYARYPLREISERCLQTCSAEAVAAQLSDVFDTAVNSREE